ncbi:hypothetical protein ES703_38670 [subsurface metagenome]
MVEENFLHKIKKVVSFDTGFSQGSTKGANEMVNAFLDNGWIILNTHTVDSGDPRAVSQYTVFTLGNTDPNADIEALKNELREKAQKEFEERYPSLEIEE